MADLLDRQAVLDAIGTWNGRAVFDAIKVLPSVQVEKMNNVGGLKPIICPQCGGTISRASMTCEYCGTTFSANGGFQWQT